MAQSDYCVVFFLALLSVEYVSAQDVLGKMLATDAIWSGVKKDAIHSHLQRMLQMDPSREEQDIPEICSPAALMQEKKCISRSSSGPKTAATQPSPNTAVFLPECKGPDCVAAPLPPRSMSSEGQPSKQHEQKQRQAHGGHLHDVFGIPLPSSFAAPGGELKDAFGIPLPVTPSTEKPSLRADLDKQSDSRSPSITATTSETKPSATKAPNADFDMTMEPLNLAIDPSALHRELEAFIAASPVLKGATRGIKDQAVNVVEQPKVEQQPKAEQQPEKQQEDTASGPAQSTMTDRQAERLAAQQAANAAARDAALERKKQMVREEMAAAASKKTKRSTTSSAGASSTQQPIRPPPSSLPFSSATSVHAQQQHHQQLRRTSSAKWGVLSYLFVAVVMAASLVGLFAAAAVLEDVLVARKYDTTTSLPLHWLAVTRSLWRRVRRAFGAARKQLTGHGSDLPMSVNEGTGPVASAFAASSAFVHVFWSHLVDHRGQGLGSAVAAAVDASRRASAGGVAPDRSSSGGAVSPFAAPQYQQAFVMEADLRRRH